MRNRFSFFLMIFSIIIFPISVNAQQDNLTTNDQQNQIILQKINEIEHRSANLQNELSSIQSEISETNNILQDKLQEISKQLNENQLHDERVQFMYTLAQVTGVFVAIMGGFFTTKVLASSTEKNRTERRIKEIDSELKNKKSIIEHYQGIVDDIRYSWARREVEEFKNKLLSSAGLTELSIDKIIERFTAENDNKPPNEYEEDLLRQDHEQILESIRKKIEENKKTAQKSPSNLFATIMEASHVLCLISVFYQTLIIPKKE